MGLSTMNGLKSKSLADNKAYTDCWGSDHYSNDSEKPEFLEDASCAKIRKLLAIHLHLFHLSQLPSFIDRIKALKLSKQADLYLTVPNVVSCSLDELAEKVQRETGVRVYAWKVLNAGYDVGGFVYALHQIPIENYRYILKLHTKSRKDDQLTRINGRYLSDALWGDALVNSLIGNKEIFERNIERMDADPSIGMLGSSLCLTYERNRTQWALSLINDELEKSGLPAINQIGFFAGTMFMTVAELMMPFRRWSIHDFPVVDGYVKDWSLAHLFERAFGAFVLAQNRSLVGVDEPSYRRRLLVIACRRIPGAIYRKARRGKNKLMRSVRTLHTCLSNREFIAIAGLMLAEAARGKRSQQVHYFARLFAAKPEVIREILDHGYRGVKFFLTRDYWRILKAAFSAGAIRDLALLYSSPFFNRDWYERIYPDVRRKGLPPVLHYLVYGWRVGFRPSCEFNGAEYLALNPDVRAAGINPLLHFERIGRFENRRYQIRKGVELRGVFLYCFRLVVVVRFLFRLLRRRDIEQLRNLKFIYFSHHFSSRWYLATYPDIRMARIPLSAHYLYYGWKETRDPSPRFSTSAYLKQNPDVRIANVCPLLHYEKSGKYENRGTGKSKTIKAPRFARLRRGWGMLMHTAQVKRNGSARILVHLHLFYPTLWPAIDTYLRNLYAYSFDLVISHPSGISRSVLKAIKKSYPGVRLVPCENRGFDIGPFCEILRDVDLSNYDIVYHLHSKGPTGEMGRYVYGRIFAGDDWFRQLYDGCLGFSSVHDCIDLLRRQKGVGLVCSKSVLFKDEPSRQALVRLFASARGVSVPDDYQFVGGTCFAVKAEALKPLQNMGLRMQDFSESNRFVFSFGHAMERIIPITILNAGYTLHGLRVRFRRHILGCVNQRRRIRRREEGVRKTLRKLGVEAPKVLKLDLVSGTNCTFAKGIYDGEPVFIKLGGIQGAAENEFKMQRAVRKILLHHVPRPIRYDPEVSCVIMEYLEGMNLGVLLDAGLDGTQARRIVSDLKVIGKTLKKHRYLHRDLRPENFVYAKGRLYLIDFQFMVRQKPGAKTFNELPFVRQNPALTLFLGDKYRPEDGSWDDVYSLNKIVAEVESRALQSDA